MKPDSIAISFKESQNMAANFGITLGTSNPNAVTSKEINKIMILDQVEYDALIPDARTLYFIKG